MKGTGKVPHGVVPVMSLDPRQITHTVHNICTKRFTHVRIFPTGTTAKGRFAALMSLPGNNLWGRWPRTEELRTWISLVGF